jgi:hypothetical protein
MASIALSIERTNMDQLALDRRNIGPFFLFPLTGFNAEQAGKWQHAHWIPMFLG